MKPNEIIGRNIKTHREINGFTQDVVSKFLGIKRELISYYETGAREIPFITLEKLSELYGVDLDAFYEEDDKLVKENALIAFRTEGLEKEDLEAISQFKVIVKNYLKMNKLDLSE